MKWDEHPELTTSYFDVNDWYQGFDPQPNIGGTYAEFHVGEGTRMNPEFTSRIFLLQMFSDTRKNIRYNTQYDWVTTLFEHQPWSRKIMYYNVDDDVNVADDVDADNDVDDDVNVADEVDDDDDDDVDDDVVVVDDDDDDDDDDERMMMMMMR